MLVEIFDNLAKWINRTKIAIVMLIVTPLIVVIELAIIIVRIW